MISDLSFTSWYLFLSEFIFKELNDWGLESKYIAVLITFALFIINVLFCIIFAKNTENSPVSWSEIYFFFI